MQSKPTLFLPTLFLKYKAQTSEKTESKESQAKNSVTLKHFQKWAKPQGVILALSPSFIKF